MDRRSLLLGGSAALTTILCAPAVRAADRYYNHYVTGQAEQGLTATHVAKSGDTWDSLFGERVEVARFYNRQNLQLETGQLVLLPPEGITDFMSPSMAPFAAAWSDEWVFVLISPARYAWGLFRGSQLVRWGPAVCGSDWCADVGRSCLSPQGMFPITEIAGPDRRSGSYLIDQAAEGKGALMPYFMKITDYGVGLYSRNMRGRHETHGHIGLFEQDAMWLNALAQRGPGTLHVKVLDYTD